SGGLIAQSLYSFYKGEYGGYPYLDTLCLFYSQRIFVACRHTIKTLWPSTKELQAVFFVNFVQDLIQPAARLVCCQSLIPSGKHIGRINHTDALVIRSHRPVQHELYIPSNVLVKYILLPA